MRAPYPLFSNSADESPLKEDFGRLLRRIMHTNSGQFRALGSTQVVNHEWLRYREQAENAAMRGNYAQAESMWLAALSEAQSFEENDPRILYTLNCLASLYSSLGRYEQAEMFCKRELDLSIEIYGGYHVRVADCLNNLAGIYYNQQRYAEAQVVCLKLLAMYEAFYGPDHADVGMAANNLAMVYHVRGKYVEAEEMYQRALRIRARVLGKNHPCIQTLLENYANLLGTICQTAQPKNSSLSQHPSFPVHQVEPCWTSSS